MWNPNILEKAWTFAARHHKGQTYGGQTKDERVEYMTHIGSVIMEVAWALQDDASADGDLAIQCAALHDTIEDTGTTFEQIKELFGQSVAEGVLALSKNPAIPDKRLQMEDSLLRIQRLPREIAMVKMADRIANLYAPPYYWDNEKISAYQNEARLIHKTLYSASATLASRLEEKIVSYSQFLRSIDL